MSTQQEIIYPGINAASRAEARQLKKGFGREHMFISYGDIALKSIGNWRRKASYQTQQEWIDSLGLESLADLIYANSGPADAIEGDVEKGTGKFFITEGQRRWMAIGLLLDRGLKTYPSGADIDKVEVLCNPSGFTDADRLKKNYSSQNKMSLKPSELAAGFLLYKNSFLNEDGKKFSNAEIAEQFGFSRQYIDNMLRLNELDPEILRQLDYSEITQTQALSGTRKHRATKEDSIDESPFGDKVFVPGGFQTMPHATAEQFHIEGDEDTDIYTHVLLHPIEEEEQMAPFGGQIETKAAIDVEEEMRKTPSRIPEQVNNEKKEAAEAMISIDFTPDKIQGEFLINESIKNMDKMSVIINNLPINLKQYKADLDNYIAWNITKLNDLRDILKKAADTR